MATPVSLVEWFLNFYEAAQEADTKPVEGIVRAGEVLFVPRGWWHLAINLEVMPAPASWLSILPGVCWNTSEASRCLRSSVSGAARVLACSVLLGMVPRASQG